MPAATLTYASPTSTVDLLAATLYTMGFTGEFDGGFVRVEASLPATPTAFKDVTEIRRGGQLFSEYRSPGTKLKLTLQSAGSAASVNFEATAIA